MNPFDQPQVKLPQSKPIGGLYTVHLSIEGMKHQIEQCLLDHDGSLRATVEQELKVAVGQFDFNREVSKCAESAIKSLVSQAIERAVREAFRDDSVSQSLNDIIVNHLRTVLKEKK